MSRESLHLIEEMWQYRMWLELSFKLNWLEISIICLEEEEIRKINNIPVVDNIINILLLTTLIY